MASSTAPVAQNEAQTSPPPPSRIIILEGHISGEKGLISLEIDWLGKVIDLKKAIKKDEPALNHLAPRELDVYKLDIVNKDDNGYAGLKSRWTLDQYLTGAWSCLELEDTDYLHKLWSDGKGTPTNEAGKIHFLVVLPDPEKNEPPAKRQKILHSKSILPMDIDDLVMTLRQWIKKQGTLKPPMTEESLRAFGNSFPLQQCDGIFSSIRDRMLVSFKVKMAGSALDWKKDIEIPIVGAASGTGKTSICSRMLKHLAHRAQKHDSPPSSAHGDSDSPTQNPYDLSSMRTVISDPNATPENYLPTDAKVDRSFWTPERLEDFRHQLIRSNERRLTLIIDFMVQTFPEHMNVELRLAALILVAYQKIHYRGGPMWKTEDELISFLEGQSLPLDVALKILRRVENNNIIVIHLDETQAVSLKILNEVVRGLVARMGPDEEGKFPFIFPILSGLSLETLLTSTMLSGAGIVRYTPPVLTVHSMLTIIDAMLSGDGATKPSKPLGLQMLLHDLRGPTRYFQAALFFLQQYSSHDQSIFNSFELSSIIDRKAMRAGLEKDNQNWLAVFNAVVRLTHKANFIRDLNILKENNRLMVELFKLDVLGKEISVDQKFMIGGQAQPLSYLIQRGWLTICDFAGGCRQHDECRIFLPFLTVYSACRGSGVLTLADHPGLVPLCEGFSWSQNERYDAKTLQYKLLIPWIEGNSSPPKCKLSAIFGNLGAVADVAFVIPAAPQYTELPKKVETFKQLNKLILSSGSCPTVYLNAERAKFADSFVFLSLEQSSQHKHHILCIQSKLFTTSALSFGQVQEEYEKVRVVCGSHPFTLVIAADQLRESCLTRFANATDKGLKSHVLVLDREGFETFYGKPFAYRRSLLTQKELPLFCKDQDNPNPS